MDPSANLREQLLIAQRIAEEEGTTDDTDICRLAELIIALDGWIKGGGFLPSQWSDRP